MLKKMFLFYAFHYCFLVMCNHGVQCGFTGGIKQYLMASRPLLMLKKMWKKMLIFYAFHYCCLVMCNVRVQGGFTGGIRLCNQHEQV